METPDIVIVPLVLFPTAIFLPEAPPPSVIVGVTLPMKVQFVHGADHVILLSTVLPLITHLLELLSILMVLPTVLSDISPFVVETLIVSLTLLPMMLLYIEVVTPLPTYIDNAVLVATLTNSHFPNSAMVLVPFRPTILFIMLRSFTLRILLLLTCFS